MILQDRENSAKIFEIYHDLENCVHHILKMQDLVS